MKPYLLLLFLGLGFFTAAAQKVILVQDGAAASLYETLGEAVENAPAGATIYLPGGQFDVPSGELVIDKELHIIGAGHHPDSARVTGRTRIAGSIYLITGADNGSLEGVYLDRDIGVGKNSVEETNMNGYIIKRVNFGNLDFFKNVTNGQSKAQFFLIKHCIIRSSIYGDNAKNITFLNNHINGIIQHFDNGNVVFENNIFPYTRTSYLSDGILRNIDEVIFRNNIFLDLSSTNSSNNEYYNNISSISNADFSAIFVNYSGGNFNYSNDYHLAPNSPAKGAGLNGTDIGIYGGGSPYKEGAIPSNPHIQLVDIANQTGPDGRLRVKIKVSAQQN